VAGSHTLRQGSYFTAKLVTVNLAPPPLTRTP
jgi:hypothetical protein